MNFAASPHLLELLAASHALGTLRGGARRRFETIAREQPAVRAAALVWQSRLASMAELQLPAQPDPAVWIRIRNLVDAEQTREAEAARGIRAKPADKDDKPKTGWLRNVWLWRGTTAVGILATLLVAVVGLNLQKQLDTAPVIQYVAVLHDDNEAPAMLVTFDPNHKQLVLQRVGGYREGSNKSLQLWALPPAGTPRSLGVLGDGPAIHIQASESAVNAVPALAISLEPKGGAPEGGGPTGPVLFKGALIKKTT